MFFPEVEVECDGGAVRDGEQGVSVLCPHAYYIWLHGHAFQRLRYCPIEFIAGHKPPRTYEAMRKPDPVRVDAKPLYEADLTSYIYEWNPITDERHVENAKTALQAYNHAVPDGGDRFFLENLLAATTITVPDSGLTCCHFNFIANCEATGDAALFFAEVEIVVDDDGNGGVVRGGEKGVVVCCIIRRDDYSIDTCHACTLAGVRFVQHPSGYRKFIAGHRPDVDDGYELYDFDKFCLEWI
uniref:DUF3615 domain-containing protein n=1 Tax=Leersia perrieri TaxID=77586 RepID=A0A0D9XIM6_9ORYZ